MNTREDFSWLDSLVRMKRRFLITALALGLVMLALGGWLVQAVRLTPRLLASAS